MTRFPAVTRFIASICQLARTDEGQDLLEYAMLMALIVVAAMLSVQRLGIVINDIFWAPIGRSI